MRSLALPCRRAAWPAACSVLAALAACPEPPAPATDAAVATDAGQDAGPNTSPTAAIAGAAERQHPRGFPLELDGSGSSDPDGDTLYYLWSVQSPTAPSGCTAHQGVTNQPLFLMSPPCAGDYRVELLVQDARMASSTPAHVALHVEDLYRAEAGDNRDASLGQTLTLSAAASVLPTEPGIVKYNWALLTRPAYSTAVIQDSREGEAHFTAVDPHASYEIELQVTYDDVPLQPDRFFVNVLNSTPVADAGTDLDVAMSDSATLDGSASLDPDGDALNYAWSIAAPDRGCTLSDATTATPTFTAGSSGGSVIVTLTVRDVFGGEASDSLTVRIP